MRFLVRDTVERIVEGDPMKMTPASIRKQLGDADTPRLEESRFLVNGRVADDSTPICHHMYNTAEVFSHASTLEVIRSVSLDFDLEFDFNGFKEHIRVNWNDKIEVVKGKAKEKFGVATKIQYWSIGSCGVKDDEILLDALVQPSLRVELRIIFTTQIKVIAKNKQGETQTIRCLVSTTVEEFKSMVQAPVGPVTDDHRFLCNGQQLQGGQMLWDCNVRNGSEISLATAIRGCGCGCGQNNGERGEFRKVQAGDSDESESTAD